MIKTFGEYFVFSGQELQIFPEVVYTGDNADCSDFLKKYNYGLCLVTSWPFGRLDTMRFADYRRMYTEDSDDLKMKLMEVKSMAFRRMLTEDIDGAMVGHLFRYAWSKAKPDAGFERWVESFDRNDPDNISIAERYFRWYLRRYPAEKGQNRSVYYLNSLKKVFVNQEIIDVFADEYIQEYLKQAPEGMAEVFEVCKQVSVNTEAHAEAEKLFRHYSKLMKGAPAIDFGMTDVNGKKYRLSDLRGKAVYIDVWATWCGPCCMEIPHMKKLAEHYAKNKKIELVSISLDQDLTKWKKKLAVDKPGWKQFVCPDHFESALCQEYDIEGIPRFMFFDRKGRIISLNAPRPSEAGIIDYIDRHIQ